MLIIHESPTYSTFQSIWRVRLYFRGNYECKTFIITYFLCAFPKIVKYLKVLVSLLYCRLYQGLEWIVNNIRNRWWCDYDTHTHTTLKNSRMTHHQRLKKTYLVANDDIYICGVMYNSKKQTTSEPSVHNVLGVIL